MYNRDPEIGQGVPIHDSNGSDPERITKRFTTFMKTRLATMNEDGSGGLRGDYSYNRKRFDILPRSGHVVELNVTEILKPSRHHDEFCSGGITLRGLAKFDDATKCAINDSQEKYLIVKEIEKLIQFAKSDQPQVFDSQGVLGQTDLSGYEALSGLADQVLCNFQIIKHDNYTQILERCPKFTMDAILGFKSSRVQLLRRYRNDKDHVEGRLPKRLPDEGQNQQAYFALVDFIFGVMAWWLIRNADCNHWKTSLLNILAQWVVKLKAISFSPIRFAERSLSEGEDLMTRMLVEAEEKDALVLKVRSAVSKQDKVSSDLTSVRLLDEEGGLDTAYYMEKMLQRSTLTRILHTVLCNLIVPEKAANDAETFYACTLIYHTGLDRVATLLCSDRDGDISATSELQLLTYSYPAMQYLVQVMASLQGRSQKLGIQVKDIATRVRWKSRDRLDQSFPVQELHVNKMDDIVSMMIPLALTSATAVREVEQLIGIVSATADDEDQIRQFQPLPPDYEAEFSVTTQAWLTKSHRMRNDRFHDPDIVTVSSGPMRMAIRAGTKLGPMISDTPSESAASVAETRAENIIKQYESHAKRMRSWVIAESSITVDCSLYSRIVITISASLVLGSLAVPFIVGERITGVDPFQIPNYTWFVVGFILIVAKSRYVSDWPWHDFIRGHVVCKTIKELAEVSGMDPQMILLYLMHNEYRHTLKVSGPFTGMFTHRSETGFVINVPVHISTIFASGFLLFKVLNQKGEHLICIDVRKGCRVIQSRDEEAYTSSMDIKHDETGRRDPHSGNAQMMQHSDEKETSDAPVVTMLAPHTFRWNKMLGLTWFLQICLMKAEQQVQRQKVSGSWNLHTVLPKGLDFFVLLSSISGIVRSAGQANCAAANTYMDALAHYRHALGERAVALDLGAMLGHGVLATNEALRDRILRAGLLRGVSSSELLALLDDSCGHSTGGAVAGPRTAAAQVAIGLAPASELKAASPQRTSSPLLSLPLYRHVFAGTAAASTGQTSGEGSNQARRRQDFVSAKSTGNAGVIVSAALLQRLVTMTPGLRDRLDANQLDEAMQTFEVDYLQAIELRSWFMQEFAADVPIFVILGDETLASLGLLVAGKGKLRAT